MQMKRILLAGVLVTLFQPLFASATEDLDQVTECMDRNIPQTTTVQTVEFRVRDRTGDETVRRAKIWGKRFEDGYRRLLMHFYEPEDLSGSELLIHEKKQRSDMWLYPSATRQTRRVSARGVFGSLAGTDLSYEDFERLQGLHTGSQNKRQPNSELDGQTVYVLESRPGPEEESAYEKVLTFISKEKCVPLKIESYETGGRLRKQITMGRAERVQETEIWLAREILVKDIRDKTETRVVVEKIEIDQPLNDRLFNHAQLGRRRN
jgi:hypothetical protein